MQGLPDIVRLNFKAANRELLERVRKAADKQDFDAVVRLLKKEGLRVVVKTQHSVSVITEKHRVWICNVNSVSDE